jgi:hypothetical protein
MSPRGRKSRRVCGCWPYVRRANSFSRQIWDVSRALGGLGQEERSPCLPDNQAIATRLQATKMARRDDLASGLTIISTVEQSGASTCPAFSYWPVSISHASLCSPQVPALSTQFSTSNPTNIPANLDCPSRTAVCRAKHSQSSDHPQHSF